MSKIMVAFAAGIAFPEAVKGALGMKIKDVAAEEGFSPNTLSAVINGSTGERYNNVRDALARRLGVPREWIDEQVNRQRRLYLERQAEQAGAAAA